MIGGAQRSPFDLPVLPQPRDFYPRKIEKIAEISMSLCNLSHALWPIFMIFSFFH
jgi:hypothetical protein